MKSRFAAEVETICKRGRVSANIEHDDERHEDLTSAISLIVSDVTHAGKLDRMSKKGLEPTEHDRRFPIDRIMAMACSDEDDVFFW